MVSIDKEKFLEDFKKNNPGENIKAIRKALDSTIAAKKKGTTCLVCGQPIWTIGSALCGNKMCFTCITGESDSSEDYEIDEVNS